MNKKILLSILLAISTGQVFSQNKTAELKDSVESYIKRGSLEITNDSLAEQYFSRKAYDKYFDKYFTQLNFDKDALNEGNAASLKITDNQTKLNLNLSKKSNSSIFTVGTALNISDNTGTLFTGSKPTAGTQFSLGYAHLIMGQRLLKFDYDKSVVNFKKRRKMLDSLRFLYVEKNPLAFEVLQNELASLRLKIDSIQNNIATAFSNADLNSWRDQLFKSLEDEEKVLKNIELLDFDNTVIIKTGEITEAAENAVVEKELNNYGITVARLQWISSGAAYQRFDYATYDSTLSFSKRVDSKSFDKFSFSGAYNLFWQRTNEWIKYRKTKGFNSFYGNIGYSASQVNSYEVLTESNLTTSRSIIRNDTVYQFSAQQKLRDVTGKSFTSFWQHKLSIQAIGMLGYKQFFGINISASTEISKAVAPLLNSRIGFLFKFIDADDEKSKVNFEIFLCFKDMSDTKNSGKSVWQNKQIGVSATVPFQKVFFR